MGAVDWPLLITVWPTERNDTVFWGFVYLFIYLTSVISLPDFIHIFTDVGC